MNFNSYHLHLNSNEFQYVHQLELPSKKNLVCCFISKKSLNPNLDIIMKALEPYHNDHPKFLQSMYSL
jgi:hypothetical protein